jgi:hypothetical protein
MPKRSGLSTTNIAGNTCRAVLSAIHASCIRCARNTIAVAPQLPKGLCTDSESPLLAIKKFSCLTPLTGHQRSPRTVFLRIAEHRFATSARRSDGKRGARWAVETVQRRHDRATKALDASRSDAELGLQQVVDRLRIGLAARRLHHLANEPADQLRLGFRLRDLVRIAGDDVVDHLFDRA